MTPVTIESGFDASRPMIMSRLEKLHYGIQAEESSSGGYYVLLSLAGVRGQRVRIDLTGPPFDGWVSAIPLYSTVESIDDPTAFESAAVKGNLVDRASRRATTATATTQRGALPDTQGQQWHFIKDVWYESGKLCLRHTFDSDKAYISLRIPYTVAHNERFLAGIQSPDFTLTTVGTSQGGRPLKVATITSPGGTSGKREVVIYAREHADEQDSSWVAQGAIQYLMSEAKTARELKNRFVFVVIPILDPDGAVSATHENIMDTFGAKVATPESIAYANWFKARADEGLTPDVVLALHNPPPGTAFNLACPMMEPQADRLRQCEALHQQIRQALLKRDFTVRNTPWTKATASHRLSGWLSEYYGTLVLPYEVNSQAKTRRLTLNELREIGAVMVQGSVAYLSSTTGKELLVVVDSAREQRLTAMKKWRGEPTGRGDALYLEAAYRKTSAEELLDQTWRNPLQRGGIERGPVR